MALEEAPPFWWENPSWQAWLLSPLSFVYGRAAAKRMNFTASASVDVPVICVGNFITGGAGKTPTVEMLSRFVRALGMRPGVLTRGYGGAITAPTIVKKDKHNAHDVGDEALLHANHAITVVSADRPGGAQLLSENGCQIILMDDGFQNPSLMKDFNLVVVDAKRGLGNGFSVPAGPVRVPFRNQLMRADAVLVIGEGKRGEYVIRRSSRAGKPVIAASVKPKNTLPKKKYLAYAGIADTSKFSDTLEKIGTDVEEVEAFGDHHFYTDEECADLLERAKANDMTLLTTSKDAARLSGMGKLQDKLLDASQVLKIELQVEDSNLIDHIIHAAIENCAKRRLAAKKSAQKITE